MLGRGGLSLRKELSLANSQLNLDESLKARNYMESHIESLATCTMPEAVDSVRNYLATILRNPNQNFTEANFRTINKTLDSSITVQRKKSVRRSGEKRMTRRDLLDERVTRIERMLNIQEDSKIASGAVQPSALAAHQQEFRI